MNPMNPKDKSDIGGGLGNPSSAGTAAARAKDLDSPEKSAGSSEQKSTNVVNKVSEVASELADKVTHNYETIREKAGDYYDSAINYSRQNTGKALLISVGVGFLFGYLLTPRRPNYSETLNCMMKDGLNLLLDRIF